MDVTPENAAKSFLKNDMNQIRVPQFELILRQDVHSHGIQEPSGMPPSLENGQQI